MILPLPKRAKRKRDIKEEEEEGKDAVWLIEVPNDNGPGIAGYLQVHLVTYRVGAILFEMLVIAFLSLPGASKQKSHG
ncbi:MAG: hypothetical protein WCE57_12545 [Salegentibacter sp.]